MTQYSAPVADSLFALRHVLGIDRYAKLPGFDVFQDGSIELVLAEAGRFAESVLQPLNAGGDREGCTFHADGSVTTPPGFRSAYRQFCAAGWNSLSVPEWAGGQGLSATVATCVEEYFNAANQSFMMYTGWGTYAAAMLQSHGSETLKRDYLPKLVSGEWSGTMAITEPHCGTDIGLLRTRARPHDDGSFRLAGTKIFISSGNHDLTENIIHFVLARIEGSPPGTRGLSLFLCPKQYIDPDTSILVRNEVHCTGTEHKMGLRGSATCTMHFDQAHGWLIGEKDQGLSVMFLLMNHIRRLTGTIAVGVADAAYQRAAARAKERLQGRALDPARRQSSDADPLILQPDVRRVLMTIRSFTEAGRALVLWTSLKADLAARSDDLHERKTAEALIELITPVTKAFLSDKSFESAVLAQQLFGGHGYITETGIDQFLRDARILMIAEGANGVQAMDLVLRKIRPQNGLPVEVFLREVEDAIAQSGNPHRELVALRTAVSDLRFATREVLEADTETAALAAYSYMTMLGLVALGYMWFLSAKAGHEHIAKGDTTAVWGQKIATAQFFAGQILPEVATHLARIRSGDSAIMNLEMDQF